MRKFYLNEDPDGGGGSSGTGDPGSTSGSGDPGSSGQGDGSSSGSGDPGSSGQADPPPITDEVLYQELGKRYGEKGIKSKEDLDRVIEAGSRDYSGHIKAKSPLVQKLNEWDGDVDTFFKLQKLDIDKLDNRSKVIEATMLKEGVDREMAELLFEKDFGSVILDPTDENYDEREAKLANFRLSKMASEADESLRKWKAQELEKGQQKPDPDAAAKAEKAYKDNWETPALEALKNLQKIDFSVKFTLPDVDKTEVTEPLTYVIGESDDVKKVVQDLLSSKTSDQFLAKFVSRYGMDEDGKTPNFNNLVRAISRLELAEKLINHAAGDAASKALSKHLEKVFPGGVGKERFDGKKAQPVDTKQSIVDSMNKKAQQELNN